jgi:hypothetical protein
MHRQRGANKPTLVDRHVYSYEELSQAIHELGQLGLPLSGSYLGFAFSNTKKSIITLRGERRNYRLSDNDFNKLISVASKALSADGAVNISGRDAATVIASFSEISKFNNKEQSRAFLKEHAITLANSVAHDRNATSQAQGRIKDAIATN